MARLMSSRMRKVMENNRYHTMKVKIQELVEAGLAADTLQTVHFDEALQAITKEGELWVAECYSGNHTVTMLYYIELDTDDMVVRLVPQPYQECPRCDPNG